MYIAQIDTMKCFYCPQKGPSVVPWDSSSPADQALLRVKHPESSESAVWELCFRSAHPSSFFMRRVTQSGSTSLATQSLSLDSGL